MRLAAWSCGCRRTNTEMGEPGLIDRIGRWIDQWNEEADPAGPPPILGIAGSQGSGKSTLAHEVAERFGGRPCRWTTSI